MTFREIPLTKLYFPPEDIDRTKVYAEKTLASGMLTLGEYTKAAHTQVYIRPFSPSDILPLHKMYSSLSEESKKLFSPSFFESPSPKWLLSNLSLLPATSPTIKRLLLRWCPKAVSLSLVALNARDELIGFTYIIGDSLRKTIGICIRDDYQNIGLGSNLLGHTITLAKKEKIDEIYAWIRIDNIRAIKLFQKFGFRTIHLAEKCTKRKRKDRDCAMYLRLF